MNPFPIIKKLEDDIRPKSFREFIGQKELRDRMTVYLESARIQGKPLDHCLFYGPPGTGKTTVAEIIAHEQNRKIIEAIGPALSQESLVSILANLKAGDIFFIDEIHRLDPTLEEQMYPVMESFKYLDPDDKSGNSFMPVPPFTLIGATTRYGMLSNPLRNRFQITESIDFYPVEALEQIVMRTAHLLEMPISDSEVANQIAARSRGTPRIANNIVRRVKDYFLVSKATYPDFDLVGGILVSLGIDKLGLTQSDRKILRCIIDQFMGGPVGLETLSHASGEDIETITDTIEPFLQRIGFISRTPKGRIATDAALKHMEENHSDSL